MKSISCTEYRQEQVKSIAWFDTIESLSSFKGTIDKLATHHCVALFSAYQFSLSVILRLSITIPQACGVGHFVTSERPHIIRLEIAAKACCIALKVVMKDLQNP